MKEESRKEREQVPARPPAPTSASQSPRPSPWWLFSQRESRLRTAADCRRWRWPTRRLEARRVPAAGRCTWRVWRVEWRRREATRRAQVRRPAGSRCQQASVVCRCLGLPVASARTRVAVWRELCARRAVAARVRRVRAASARGCACGGPRLRAASASLRATQTTDSIRIYSHSASYILHPPLIHVTPAPLEGRAKIYIPNVCFW